MAFKGLSDQDKSILNKGLSRVDAAQSFQRDDSYAVFDNPTALPKFGEEISPTAGSASLLSSVMGALGAFTGSVSTIPEGNAFFTKEDRGAQLLDEMYKAKGHSVPDALPGAREVIDNWLTEQRKLSQEVERIRSAAYNDARKDLAEAEKAGKPAGEIEKLSNAVGKRQTELNEVRTQLGNYEKSRAEVNKAADGYKTDIDDWKRRGEEMKHVQHELDNMKQSFRKDLEDRKIDLGSAEFAKKIEIIDKQEQLLVDHKQYKVKRDNDYRKELKDALPKEGISKAALKSFEENLFAEVSGESPLGEKVAQSIKQSREAAFALAKEASEQRAALSVPGTMPDGQVLDEQQEAKFKDARKNAIQAEEIAWNANEKRLLAATKYEDEMLKLQHDGSAAKYVQRQAELAETRELLAKLDPGRDKEKYDGLEKKIGLLNQAISIHEDKVDEIHDRYRSGMFSAMDEVRKANHLAMMSQAQINHGKALVSGDKEAIEFAAATEAKVNAVMAGPQVATEMLAHDAGKRLEMVAEAKRAREMLSSNNIEKFVEKLLEPGGYVDKAYASERGAALLDVREGEDKIAALQRAKDKFAEKLKAQAGRMAGEVQYLVETIENSNVNESRKDGLKQQAVLQALDHKGGFASKFLHEHAPEIAPVNMHDLAAAADRPVVTTDVIRIQVGQNGDGELVARIHQAGDRDKAPAEAKGALVEKLLANGFSFEGAGNRQVMFNISSSLGVSEQSQLALLDTVGRNIKLGTYNETGSQFMDLGAASEALAGVNAVGNGRLEENRNSMVARLEIRGQRNQEINEALAARRDAVDRIRVAKIRGDAAAMNSLAAAVEAGDPKAMQVANEATKSPWRRAQEARKKLMRGGGGGGGGGLLGGLFGGRGRVADNRSDVKPVSDGFSNPYNAPNQDVMNQAAQVASTSPRLPYNNAEINRGDGGTLIEGQSAGAAAHAAARTPQEQRGTGAPVV